MGAMREDSSGESGLAVEEVTLDKEIRVASLKRCPLLEDLNDEVVSG